MMMGLCPELPPRDYSDIPYYSLYTNGQGWVKDKKSGKALGKPHVITVQKGKRYRFRTIQGAASWGMKVEPLSHPIEIIAVDGAETERTPAKGYIFTPGERVDFLLNANQPVGGAGAGGACSCLPGGLGNRAGCFDCCLTVDWSTTARPLPAAAQLAAAAPCSPGSLLARLWLRPLLPSL